MNNQINSAVRKIHNLLSSGAVTVTGPNQSRILKQKVGTTTVTPTNNLQQVNNGTRCYICDELLGSGQAQHPLTEMRTSHTSTKFANKIGQLVGESFMVIVSGEDVVCARCTNLINYLDRLENDVERVRSNLMNFLFKKYGLNDDSGGGGESVTPPAKVQKLNSGTSMRPVEEVERARKLPIAVGNDLPQGKQSPPVSAVQQLKISTAPVVQHTAGTQTLQRKTTKIYKCLSCDYKTSDMRLFNTHYETCKQQNFQCKNCKKIFPNFGSMKQHMVREHNTAMDNTCSVCHVNFVNEAALRKHMELNHSTHVVVTSTTTIPAGAAVAVPNTDSMTPNSTSTSLYTCNQCQFKSTDKALFDEHLRKHLSGLKSKPFKCRLCAQRFETREAATIHAKQHQTNYFKCGTCAMSFPKRELLVKHFEVHQTQAASQPTQIVTQQTTMSAAKQTQQQQAQATSSPQNSLTTQKLLQETIDEALSEGGTGTSNTETSTTTANNIRFFSCHICSLTFIKENYYNQHMETHRREKKGGANVATTATASSTTVNSTSLTTPNSTNSAILNDGISSSTIKVDGDGHASNALQSNSNAVNINSNLDTDIESIFEKMHSDKGESSTGNADNAATSVANTASTNTTSATTGAQGAVTSQSSNITFNITIPQSDNDQTSNEAAKSTPTTSAPVYVSIDMPMLDQPDEATSTVTGRKTDIKEEKIELDKKDGSHVQAAGPVSMPSLDDDSDAHAGQAQASVTSSDTEGSSHKVEIKMENEESETKSEIQKVAAADSTSKLVSGDNNQTAVAGSTSEAGDEGATQEQLAAAAAGEQVSMELDEAMQAQVESGQIKFILNENGQILQLDNHILTDADGNQILVQDPEQIQQLLQSVGVLQSGDGLDGETLQMMTDGNGQMVLVQGENNEAQLIDASLLNAEGQLVIQQGQDGELGEGAHVIGEDGTRIPVSVSYTADGQPIVQVQQQVLDANEGSQHVVLDKDGVTVSAGGDGVGQDAGGNSGSATTGYFALEDLMQQSSTAKSSE